VRDSFSEGAHGHVRRALQLAVFVEPERDGDPGSRHEALEKSGFETEEREATFLRHTAADGPGGTVRAKLEANAPRGLRTAWLAEGPIGKVLRDPLADGGSVLGRLLVKLTSSRS
jgi:hypothetical protein